MPPPRSRRPRPRLTANTTYPCNDEPLELPSVDKPSTPVPFLEEPMNLHADTSKMDTNNVTCDAFKDLSFEKEPLLSLEAQLNEIPSLHEGSVFGSDQPSSYRASLASDLELEWEGMDLTAVTDLEDNVWYSKEEDV